VTHRRTAQHIAQLDRAADKVSRTFGQLYTVTDALYKAASELRRTSTILKQLHDDQAARSVARRRRRKGARRR
jgi:cytosine/adenosine deaminase-related metal-dependent hydrolase